MHADTAGQRASQYYEIAGHRAFATAEGWKIVAFADNKDAYTTPWDEAPWQLYRTDQDISETEDLASEHPEIVAELAAAWEKWAYAHDVLPNNRGTPRPGVANHESPPH